MKFYPLTLVAVLMAVATASAGEKYNYNNSLADCGCRQHSWKNGCCDREASCCDHLWDGYGCDQGCHSMHLPWPKLHCPKLHMNAAPYQVPCPKLPKFHHHLRGCDHGCATEPACDDAGSGCDANCEPACGCHTHVKNWFHCVLHNDACDCTCGHSHPVKNFASHMHAKLARGCGKGCEMPCGCDSGCDSELRIDLGTDGADADYESAPEEAAPLPPAPTTEPSEMKKKKTNKKMKDNKTAGMWLFPSLSL